MLQQHDPRDVPRELLRDDEGQTVSYSGACLAELLAASGENEALPMHDALPSGADFESIESTVVIAGSRPVAFPRSEGAFAVTVDPTAPPVAVPARRHVAARPGPGLLLAGIGLLVGLFAGTAFATDVPKPARTFAAPQRNEVVTQTTAFVSPTHPKLATKRKGKAVAIGAPTVAHAAPAASSPAASVPIAVNDTAGEVQQLEDRQLLLAAAAERSF